MLLKKLLQFSTIEEKHLPTMASWGSPRGRIFRDSSPTSPLTPLSPSAFPQWLRPSRSRAGVFSNGRAKIIILAIGCLSLGWLLRSTLGPNEDSVEQPTVDTASGGVLTDPSGFGMSPKSKQHGILGSHDDYEKTKDLQAELSEPKEPSVKGALSDLKHAVTDHIQSWNPYHVKPPKGYGAGSRNATQLGLDNNSNGILLEAGEDVQDGIKEEDRLGARTRIGKVTIMFYGNGFWERCIKTHEQHNKANGYRLHVLRQHLMDDVWSKPAYILSLLLRELSKPESERLEWLLWVDADTIILNPYIPIETFLPPPGTEFDDIHLMYSNDWNGLNNGVFPIRVNQWAANLFAAIVSYRHYKPEDPLVFRDQSAMAALMQEPEFAPHVVQAPQRWFNAYQGEHNETLQPFQIRRGDLLVHFAGVPAREERMQYWLERAEQHLDDWEVPVKSTSYPQEAKDFWNEQKDLRKNQKESLAEARTKAGKLLTQTDQRLNDYSDRLTEEQKAQIKERKEALKKLMDDEGPATTTGKLEEAMTKVSESASALNIVIADANKLLLQSAHSAIFAGEKDLLDSGFSQGILKSPELEHLSNTVKHLKNLVMTPEEFWSRNDILTATNSVTDARARLQDSVAQEAKVEMQAKVEQSERLAALAEVQKAAEMEASGGAVADEGYGTVPAAPVPVPPSVGMGMAGSDAGVASSDEIGGELDDTAGSPPRDPLVENVVGVTITQPGPIVYETTFVTATDDGVAALQTSETEEVAALG